MKYLFSLAVLLLSLQLQAGAQTETGTDTTLPYRKYPILPAFYILNADSTSAINTYDIPEGHYSLLVYFSPDCGHCEDLTKQITASLDRDSFRKVGIYMATPLPLSQVRAFIKKLRIEDYSNIYAGKDIHDFFPPFYHPQHVPLLVVYDEHKKFVKIFEGNFKWSQVQPYLKDIGD